MISAPSPSMPAAPVGVVWPRARWQALRAAHEARVEAMAVGFVERRSRGQKHPVEDFLFTYYNFSPAKLRQWQPPWGVSIEMAAEDLVAMPWLSGPWWRVESGLAWLCHEPGKSNRGLAAWVAELCEQVAGRVPRFGCHGLHEWAMVYQQSREQVRHQGYELRLSPTELAAFVESQSIGCSHYDAYRFFTPEARPMNTLRPTLETRQQMEQGGCLHANMDLYKWSAKLWPWVGSCLIGRCFELALRARLLDMRASPYDLAGLGLSPVRIETEQGRAEYQEEQRLLAAAAAPLREELRQCAQQIRQADEGCAANLAPAAACFP